MLTKPFHQMIAGLVAALSTRDVNNTTANGATISEPWKIGRQLVFILTGGAWGSGADGICKVQGRLRSDHSTWQDVQNVSASDLEFTQTKLDDGGAGEGASLCGTVDLERVDSTTYEALRITFINGASASQLVSVTSFIFDLYKHPGDVTDELHAQQRDI